jgi:DNA polymerase III subunit epsilon
MIRLPEFLADGLAFVDIETTGGPTRLESITEIAVVEVDEDGVREWSTLVRPEMRIPDHIIRLTGITNEMVAAAPRFAEVADALFDRLERRTFVAHNARFDHGHLKAAFKRMGVDIRPRVLCTVKLSRRLYPEHSHHSLDHLIARHGLEVAARHRALGDAQLLWQFWQRIHEHFSATRIDAAVRELLGRPALPSYLDAAEIDAIPESPGVYIFHGENALPLYIGKSMRLRTRVLSHFSGDHRSDRELSLCSQIRRVSWIESAGDLGALLQEAMLIKSLHPTHNRMLRRNRELCTWRVAPDLLGDMELRLMRAADLDPGRRDDLYGFFRSRRGAVERLLALAREHELCPPLLGLEKRGGERCFNLQLRRCRGACAGRESAAEHTARMLDALREIKVEAWPFSGPVGLREGSTLHVVDGWRYLGSADDQPAVAALLAEGAPAFDFDIYRILLRAVGRYPVVAL